ncbi:MAG: trypsin-like peptidase domain-containing protein [Gammaproteobacteria bacterium]|nr:trypsin-like peptidase domain-containing protein [Gammaproteobacteria bacterium]MCP5199807.1 trypsin-like peptidase domain-containing protein [Gammaproteobacteria bacterium]
MPIEPLLLCATPIATYRGDVLLTHATGFFFERDRRLYLVTSQHVFRSDPDEHAPDRFEITLHVDRENATRTVGYSIPLYVGRLSQWIAGRDAAGDIDVALIELDRSRLPRGTVYTAFTPRNLLRQEETIEIGSAMLIVGFPLGFHDTYHKLPVVRHAVNASSFAIRFQGSGYFLTDARTHRGSSGAPVVMRDLDGKHGVLPWILLGVHSSRFDIRNRDVDIDEALGLNCAWFADILLTLTERDDGH